MLLPSQLPLTSVGLHRDERLGEWRQIRTGDAFRRVWSTRFPSPCAVLLHITQAMCLPIPKV